MLEGASRASAGVDLKKKNERHVCTGEKEDALLGLTTLQVPDHGPHLSSPSTRRCGQPHISTRVHTTAKKATQTVRRVRFSPLAVSSGTPQEGEEEEEEEEEDDIARAAHLPQTFHHALPTSSLEP